MQPTVADRNNNPGNLRDPSTGSFRTFKSPDEGYAALLNDLQGKMTGATSTGLSGKSTLYDFASKYAPSSDNNNPAQYTANLANTLGVRPDTRLEELQPRIGDLAQAIAKNEGYSGAKGYTAQPQELTPQPTPQEQPSVGGFAKNVVQSGANFIGNTADALLHPIDTIQNIGGAAVGGIQELGGQTNDNTAKFDNLKEYFKQKYGGVSNIEHSLYTDPVGVLGDLSAALGIGGGLLNVVSKGAEVAGLGSRAVGLGAEGTGGVMAGSGVAGGAQDLSGVASKASNLTNPFTPLVAGAGAIAGKLKAPIEGGVSMASNIPRESLQTMLANPSEFTSEKIANYSRADLANEIKSALDNEITAKSEAGSAYNSFKENPIPIKVSPTFLDEAIRNAGGVELKDGVIKGTSASSIRDAADIKELQDIYNRYKPDFLNGTMDSNKFLNLRQDLADTANFNKGLTKNIQFSAQQIRENLNKEYRDQVPNLAESDVKYSAQTEKVKELRKGILDKEGNLLKTATNKIAKARGAGKELLLDQLEQLVPGITKRLEIQDAMEAIQHAGDLKVGAYTKSVLEGGAVLSGLSTGQLHIVAGAIAFAIISSPKIAVPLIRAFGANKELISAVTANLAKAANMPTVLNNAVQTGGQQDQLEQPQSPQATPETGSTLEGTSQESGQSSSQNNTTPTPELQDASSAFEKKTGRPFDLQGALDAGFKPDEIITFLNSQ